MVQLWFTSFENYGVMKGTRDMCLNIMVAIFWRNLWMMEIEGIDLENWKAECGYKGMRQLYGATPKSKVNGTK